MSLEMALHNQGGSRIPSKYQNSVMSQEVDTSKKDSTRLGFEPRAFTKLN